MGNKTNDTGSKTNAFATKLGTIFAHLVVGCIALCAMAVCIALTCKFITWVL